MSARHTLAFLAMLLLVATPGNAQTGSAQFNASAYVQGPLSVVPVQDLDFGVVIPGVNTSVGPRSPNAGVWEVTGTPRAYVAISFTLPTVLDNVQTAPGVTMPISFGNNSARWRRRRPGLGGGQRFNPAAGATGRLGGNARPRMYVYIGGTVSPGVTQLPGLYQGTIIISLFYP
ncbi:MAG: hypothetical protein ACREL6_08480, partial [Gemmatimonadales bacterium]